MVQPGTSGLAITALVTGILGIMFFMVFGFVLGVVAIVTGALGIRECRLQHRQGHGMAVAGLVLGILSVFSLPLMFLLFFL